MKYCGEYIQKFTWIDHLNKQELFLYDFVQLMVNRASKTQIVEARMECFNARQTGASVEQTIDQSTTSPSTDWPTSNISKSMKRTKSSVCHVSKHILRAHVFGIYSDNDLSACHRHRTWARVYLTSDIYFLIEFCKWILSVYQTSSFRFKLRISFEFAIGQKQNKTKKRT